MTDIESLSERSRLDVGCVHESITSAGVKGPAYCLQSELRYVPSTTMEA